MPPDAVRVFSPSTREPCALSTATGWIWTLPSPPLTGSPAGGTGRRPTRTAKRVIASSTPVGGSRPSLPGSGKHWSCRWRPRPAPSPSQRSSRRRQRRPARMRLRRQLCPPRRRRTIQPQDPLTPARRLTPLPARSPTASKGATLNGATVRPGAATNRERASGPVPAARRTSACALGVVWSEAGLLTPPRQQR